MCTVLEICLVLKTVDRGCGIVRLFVNLQDIPKELIYYGDKAKKLPVRDIHFQ